MKVVELVGFDNFDADTVEEVKEKIKPLIDRYNKMFGTEKIQNFKLVVDTFKKDRGKDLHELTMTLNTTEGNYRAKKDGWEILALVDEVESNLERQLRKKKEKSLKEREGRNA
ncbi:MAG: HPF/RaiA family ribosome-associated protein [Candidatus Aenigmarchaeota archaeon]|nr:HPF/RaiA family ribosome-associated protein [Candidatus Aenigmarchaeota archaeon]